MTFCSYGCPAAACPSSSWSCAQRQLQWGDSPGGAAASQAVVSRAADGGGGGGIGGGGIGGGGIGAGGGGSASAWLASELASLEEEMRSLHLDIDSTAGHLETF